MYLCHAQSTKYKQAECRLYHPSTYLLLYITHILPTLIFFTTDFCYPYLYNKVKAVKTFSVRRSFSL